MAREIQAAHFALPLTTSYNLAGLPFAYPPLALYLAAFLDQLGPWTLLDLLRWLPLILNLLAIPAVYWLARLLLDNNRDADFAIIAFVLLPESFRWFIMGGGLTRSTGFLFAILTLCELVLLFRNGGWRHVFLAGLFRRPDAPQPPADGLVCADQRDRVLALPRPHAHRPPSGDSSGGHRLGRLGALVGVRPSARHGAGCVPVRSQSRVGRSTPACCAS